MLEKEKERVRKLEDHFAEKMKAKGVSFLWDRYNCIATGNRGAQQIAIHFQLKGKIKAVFATKAGETICNEAKEAQATMIVMGTRGKR